MNIDVLGIKSPAWMATGDCATTIVPDLWFPVTETAAIGEQLCGECPSRVECFGFAMEHGLEGIWAGTTTTQREALRRSVNCGTRNGYERHRRNNEDACKPCKDAAALQRREQYAARREAGLPR